MVRGDITVAFRRQHCDMSRVTPEPLRRGFSFELMADEWEEAPALSRRALPSSRSLPQP
jgi:hypothetical protein